MLDVIVALAVLSAYWFTIVILDKKGLLERYDIRAYGPILMVGTKRGQKLLDFLARPKRFWRLFASVGGPLMLMTLVLIFAMLLYANYVMLVHVPYSFILPEPKGVLLLPDINELAPLVWVLIGLMLATIVHESGHAILSRVEGIRVKSMGIVLALIPIAFFTKLEGGRLSGAERGKRIRILTAGVMANFVVALVSFALFFAALSAISPVGDVMITGVTSESPADLAGIEEGGILTRLNEQNV
ncbi:MAG: site-2 protease family protein, partial [Methanocellales archaeon]|nr:site-2 protease family protein [Methanocellales archaeon]